MNSVSVLLPSLLIVLIGKSGIVEGHGRLIVPPARATLWRFREFAQFNPPVNYDDNELYCGGYGVQYGKNKGRCGPCGDRFDQPIPRDNEGGGRYGRGIIARNYTAGEIIDAVIDMKKSHWGHFEFHICFKENPLLPEEDSCFTQNPTLELGDGSGTKYFVKSDGDKIVYKTKVKLPEGKKGLAVLRWHYRTANSWGVAEDGTEGEGLGNQEIFRGCSDISIH